MSYAIVLVDLSHLSVTQSSLSFTQSSIIHTVVLIVYTTIVIVYTFISSFSHFYFLRNHRCRLYNIVYRLHNHLDRLQVIYIVHTTISEHLSFSFKQSTLSLTQQSLSVMCISFYTFICIMTIVYTRGFQQGPPC